MDIRIGDWSRLGSAVRDARKARGLSQQDLAGRAGVSRSWLARLETGHRGAELEPLLRLLNALGVTLTLRDPYRSDRDRSPGQVDLSATASETLEIGANARSAVQRAEADHEAIAAGRRQAWQDAAAYLDPAKVS